MADGTVKIKVEVDKKEAQKQLSDMSSLGAKAIGGLKTVAKASAAAVTAIGGAAIKTGADFESGMSNVQAISGATAEDMQKLTEYAKEMGRTTAFSATEASDAMSYMAMAGWKTGDMMDGLSGIMDLAAASGEDLASTSDIVTDALTAFGLQAKDSTMFADVLAAASSNANTTVGGLGESFKYVASTAGALGYSAQDVSVALGLMANAGVKGSQAGTTLRSALSKMVKPTDDAADAMEKYGISLTNQDGSMKSLDEVMQNLRQSFAGMTKEEQAQTAATLFGQEAMSGMLAVINASESDYNKLSDAINNASGSAKEMADIKLDNLKGQFTLLKSAAEGFLLELYGSGIGSALTGMVKQASDAVGELTNAFKPDGFSGLAEAGTDMVINLISGISASMPQITAKVGELISKFQQSVIQKAPLLISSAASLISRFVSGIASQLPTLIPQALRMVLTLANSITSNIPKLVKTGADLLKGLAQGVINSLPMLIEEAPKTINSFANAIYNGIGTLLSTGAQMIAQLAKGIWDNRGLIAQHAGEILLAFINIFSLSKLVSLGKNLIQSIGNGIKNAGPNLVNGAKTVGKNALNAIKKINWLDVGKSIIRFIVNGIKGIASLFTSGLKSIGTNGLNAFRSINWASVGRAALNFVINGIKGVGGALTSAMRSLGSKAMSAFKSINWKSVGTNVINGIKNGITGAAGAIATAAKNAAKKALNAAKSFLGIHSPSRVFRDEVGVMTVRGAIVGVEKEQPMLDQAYEDTFENITAHVTSADLADVVIPDLGTIIPFDSNITVTHEIAKVEKQQNDKDDIRKAVREGIAEGLDGAEVKLDGRTTGKLITPYVNKELGKKVTA